MLPELELRVLLRPLVALPDEEVPEVAEPNAVVVEDIDEGEFNAEVDVLLPSEPNEPLMLMASLAPRPEVAPEPEVLPRVEVAPVAPKPVPAVLPVIGVVPVNEDVAPMIGA